MSNNPARDVLLARLARRLKILGGVVIALAVIGLGVYFIAPQWVLRGAIAWQTWRDGLGKACERCQPRATGSQVDAEGWVNDREQFMVAPQAGRATDQFITIQHAFEGGQVVAHAQRLV